ncbi:MAG: MBL fold metallo-hydrolase [Cyanobacteria bacterium SIG30]|nr:MBL fold metallo-hydrolase [Cyanobacteria bacterium SIG30]
MHNTQNITEDLVYIGANNRRIALFENVFPVERGASYNSYLLKDEKTVLFDTIDKSLSTQFLENLEYELNGRKLDYLIINHVEPDHAGTIEDVKNKYPEVTIVCNQKSLNMLKQFFNFDIDSCVKVVKEGDILNTGKHNLTFVMAPMVHWPEVMVTYDLVDNILFSADAFGTFGALNGNIFADEVDFENDWLDDARRYYTNIVGKYGTQVQALLKKASSLDIKMICPLHGPIWRNKINWYIEKYQKWSTMEPEEQTVLIIYASVYGNTENVAEIIATKLAKKGIKNIKMYDVSKTHFSEIVSETFRCSHIVIASTTYNAGIFCNMENVLSNLKAHNIKNRKIAIIENGSWAPTAGSLIKKMFENLKEIEYIEPTFTIKSTVKENQIQAIDNLVDKIMDSIAIRPKDNNAMFKISYGLYCLFAKNKDKDNACIINTVNQITDNPKRITIAVNKENLTCEMINEMDEFNLSVLTEEAPFSLFKRFGFQTGKTADKFENCNFTERQNNGIYSLNKYSNATICAKVIDKKDYGTHILFTADVVDSKIISDVPSVTYSYYLNRIKPIIRPEKKVNGFVCKICGYVYEGSELPKDFICPICKHGAQDFEPLR